MGHTLGTCRRGPLKHLPEWPLSASWRLLSSGMAETTGTAFGFGEIVDNFKRRLNHRHQHVLGEAFAGFEGEFFLATVPAAYHQLTLIIRVNQANQIAQHDTVFMAQT